MAIKWQKKNKKWRFYSTKSSFYDIIDVYLFSTDKER